MQIFLVGVTFQNEVTLQSPPYKYEFTLTLGMTMGVQNTMLDVFEPVIYNQTDRSFYKRDSNLDTVCNKLEKVTSLAELSTIVAASGYHRHLILNNGLFPGPPIIVPKDASIEVTIHNHLYSDAVNIHWHGQEQRGTFFMDGVPGITECAIGPGESYTYKFKATTVGTHWYHAHTGVQRTEGLYGIFIVKSPENYFSSPLISNKHLSNNSKKATQQVQTTLYDKEFFIMLQDWIKGDSESVYNQIHWRNFKFFNGYANLNECFWHNRMVDGTFLPPIPFDTILFNGKGWYDLPKSLVNINASVLNLPLETF